MCLRDVSESVRALQEKNTILLLHATQYIMVRGREREAAFFRPSRDMTLKSPCDRPRTSNITTFALNSSVSWF